MQVFKDDRITVTAIENTHYPARSKAKMLHRSLALRLDTKDRSIVFAGDTAYSANVAKLARGADVFVCEIADAAMLAQMEERAKAAAAAGNPNNIFRHVAETHSSPADVARMAAEANVKMVVLNHQLAGPARRQPRLSGDRFHPGSAPGLFRRSDRRAGSDGAVDIHFVGFNRGRPDRQRAISD